MAEIQQQQYDAASAAVNQYAGKDLSQLSSDDKANLATNLAVMAKYQDSTSVYGNANVVLQNLNTLFVNGKISSTFDAAFFAGVNLAPPQSFNQAQVEKILTDIGNKWFTPSSLAAYRINNEDMVNGLKEVHRISEDGNVQAVQMFLNSKMDEAQKIKDSAKKEAEMAKWAMIGAIIGIGVGIAGAAAGGFAKGGNPFTKGFGEFGKGFAGGIEMSSRMGDATGKIIENAARAVNLEKKGEIDADRTLAEAASRMAEKAMQSNKEMADAASNQIDNILQTMTQTYRDIVHNLSFSIHG